MSDMQLELPGLQNTNTNTNTNTSTNTEPELELVKPWYLSKRFMSTAATIIQGGLMTFFGIDLTVEETSQLAIILLGIGTSVSGAITLYGLITSKSKVQFYAPKQQPSSK